MRLRLAVPAALLLAAASPLPGVGDGHTRVRVDAAAAPWQSLARLQVPGEVRCTAVLVAPRTVLTAAHCLWGPRLHHFMPAGSVHVLSGYSAGNYAHHAIAARYTLGEPALGGTEADFAVVTLAAPVGETVLPLAEDDPPAGTQVVLGGYNQDRAEVIEADLHCRIVAVLPRALEHDCAGTHGTSGAPLLAKGADGVWRIVGLQVAAFTDHAGGIAVPASTLRAALQTPPP